MRELEKSRYIQSPGGKETRLMFLVMKPQVRLVYLRTTSGRLSFNTFIKYQKFPSSPPGLQPGPTISDTATHDHVFPPSHPIGIRQTRSRDSFR